MKNEILKLVIDDYLNQVSIGISLFKKKFGETRPLKAWRDKTLPKEGKLSENIEYQFHGVGCFLIFQDYDVNFDFGPEGRSDGFDLWRITQYVQSRPEKFPEYSDHTKLEKDFETAIKNKEVVKLDHPYCNLYFYP